MLLECTSRPDPHHVAGTKATSSEASLSSCIMVVLVGGELLPQDWSWKGSAWPTFGPMLPEPSTRLGRWNTPVGPHWVTAQPLSSMAEKATWRVDLHSGNGFLEEGQLSGRQKTCINTHIPRWFYRSCWSPCHHQGLSMGPGHLTFPGESQGWPLCPVSVSEQDFCVCRRPRADTGDPGPQVRDGTWGLHLRVWGEQQRSHFYNVIGEPSPSFFVFNDISHFLHS